MERDRGSVTAEFAVALPGVVVLVAALAWGLQLAALQVRLQDAAAIVARAEARGESAPQTIAALGATVSRHTDGELRCVRLERAMTGPLGIAIALGASSCALGDGR